MFCNFNMLNFLHHISFCRPRPLFLRLFHYLPFSGLLHLHLFGVTCFTFLNSEPRQIDKRVTTPYWDFSIEGEEIYREGLGPKALVHVSKMFTDEW